MLTRSALALLACSPFALLAPTASAQVAPIQAMDAIESLTSIDDEYALFAGDDGGGLGLELYRWRADTGVTLLKDITPGPQGSSLRSFTKAWIGGQRLTFFVEVDVANGYKLWRTDGTAAGTSMVSDFGYGPPLLGLSISDLAFHPQAGTLFVSIASGSNNEEGLWSTDGTSAGTVHLVPGFFPPQNLTPFGQYLFYRQGNAVYRYDTVTGQVTSVAGVSGGSVWEIMRVGDEIAMRRSVTTSQSTMELWRIDPVAMTANLVRDFNTSGGDEVQWITRAEGAGEIYFTALNGAGVTHVYRSDLTATGTQSLGVAPGQFSRIKSSDAVGNGTFVSTASVFSGTNLSLPAYAFDTAGAGTPVDLGFESNAYFYGLMPEAHANGGTYLFGKYPGGSDALFFTTGTALGTVQLSPTILFASSMYNDIVLCDGRVLFDGRFDPATQGLLEYTLPGAYAADLGTYDGAPRMRASDPILGSTVQMSGEGAQPGTAGVLTYSLAPPAPLDLGTGVPLWVDPVGFYLVPGLLSPTWSRAFPLPNDPTLTGAKFNLQAWFVNPLTGALEGSNALRMNLAP